MSIKEEAIEKPGGIHTENLIRRFSKAINRIGKVVDIQLSNSGLAFNKNSGKISRFSLSAQTKSDSCRKLLFYQKSQSTTTPTTAHISHLYLTQKFCPLLFTSTYKSKVSQHDSTKVAPELSSKCRQK